MASSSNSVSIIDIHQLAAVVKNDIEDVLIIDSRSFLEFNTCHVSHAINVCCSKIVKRRLQQDKVSVKELLIHCCQCEISEFCNVVVYDQGSLDAESLPADSFLSVLLKKLLPVFKSVNLLQGGFLEFQAVYPTLCEDKARKCTPLTSLSQPCLPIANQGPTRILPFLYLGSQYEASNRETLKNHSITYELNVSTTCPKPEFIQDAHFMRIPVNDNYSEKLLPYFPKAFRFLDKVRESSGCVLVHCLAGISRSPTIAIAYVMRYLKMSSDDAYRYVKSKRATISPNFNFLGQLLEYEKQLCRERILDAKSEASTAPPVYGGQKRLCKMDMRNRKLSLHIPQQSSCNLKSTNDNPQLHSGDQSPTTALAKLSFGVADNENKPEYKEPIVPLIGTKFKYRSMSCSGEWFTEKEDSKVEYKDRLLGNFKTDTSRSLPALSHSFQAPERSMVYDDATKDELVHTHCNVERSRNNESAFDVIKQKHLVGMDWTAKGIPISSLKELNFTPCQTSGSSSVDSSRENTPERSMGYDDGSSTLQHSHKSYTTKFLEEHSQKFNFVSSVENMIRDYRKDFKETSTHQVSNSTWYVLNSPCVSAQNTSGPFKFPIGKEYNRSDSVSTSGIDSANSDYLDTSIESQSSIGEIPENFYDDDDLDNAVILRKSKEILRVPERNHDSAYYSLTSEDSIVNSQEINILMPSKDLEKYSSLKSSYVQVNDEACRKMSLGDKCDTSRSDSSHDSGVLGSPGWSWPDKLTCDLAELTTPKKQLERNSTRDTCSSHSEEHYQKIRMKNDTQYVMSEHRTLSKYCKLDLSVVHNDFSCKKEVQKGDGLYRAHSCPGILGWIQKNFDGSSQEAFDTEFPRLRKVKTTTKKSEKYKNRYSCGSLDYVDYHQSSSEYSYESCPDVLHCGNYQQGNGQSSSDQMASVSPSHRVFRRNVNMIQVS